MLKSFILLDSTFNYINLHTKWLLTKLYRTTSSLKPLNNDINEETKLQLVYSAIKSNNITLIKELYNKELFDYDKYKDAIIYAVALGRINIIKVMILGELSKEIIVEMFNESVDRIDVLKYLDTFFQINQQNRTNIYWKEETTAYAAKEKNISSLIYLHENGCLWDSRCFYSAITENNIKALDYLKNNSCPYDSEQDFIILAIQNNAIISLEWIQKFYPVDLSKNEFYLSIAANKGNFEIIKFLFENNALVTDRSIYTACREDNIEILKLYLLKNTEFDPLVALIQSIESMKKENSEYIIIKYFNNNTDIKLLTTLSSKNKPLTEFIGQKTEDLLLLNCIGMNSLLSFKFLIAHGIDIDISVAVAALNFKQNLKFFTIIQNNFPKLALNAIKDKVFQPKDNKFKKSHVSCHHKQEKIDKTKEFKSIEHSLENRQWRCSYWGFRRHHPFYCFAASSSPSQTKVEYSHGPYGYYWNNRHFWKPRRHSNHFYHSKSPKQIKNKEYKNHNSYEYQKLNKEHSFNMSHDQDYRGRRWDPYYYGFYSKTLKQKKNENFDWKRTEHSGNGRWRSSSREFGNGRSRSSSREFGNGRNRSRSRSRSSSHERRWNNNYNFHPFWETHYYSSTPSQNKTSNLEIEKHSNRNNYEDYDIEDDNKSQSYYRFHNNKKKGGWRWKNGRYYWDDFWDTIFGRNKYY